jgi:hypothetical protein
LLTHLSESGFDTAPKALGVDGLGREILTFIPGETLIGQPWPDWVWSEELLDEAVTVLADYHAKVAAFRPEFVESRLGTQPLSRDQIVCHNDFAPYNCVFRKGHLVGLFDWDVVCAGSPLWDLAFFAWHWVPLYVPSSEIAWRSMEECRHRLRFIADSYGLGDRTDFLQQIIRRIEASRNGVLLRAAEGDEVFERLQREGHAEEMQSTIDFVKVNAKFLHDGLYG